MNTFEMNNETHLSATGNIDDPVMISSYNVPDYRTNKYQVRRVQMTIQIFHTDLKHFDLRRATLIDADERRPIYAFNFDDAHKHVSFFTKRLPYMLAYQQIEFIEVDDEVVIGASRIFGKDLYRVRSFQSWLEYVNYGEVVSNFVSDCQIRKLGVGTLLHVPPITFDQFVSALNDEQTLVSDSIKSIEELPESERYFEVDGQKIPLEKMAEYFTAKAKLEILEKGMVN